ncbi:MAG: hypothetical protein HC886_03515 [Leptolyngbyaceae cyanobacterium SM1_1_3]|nr:hypothetical protein [Leptolyngbyaceae cyanobacterium SM1_1_3]NJN02922.1 hypothetical protein [Leptolyngbyaceae cyanobacterium RM1_1_2]NJO08876.1 hypothetical protein [Leptolyngbyaceae cyanobacterium SL_1_1]
MPSTKNRDITGKILPDLLRDRFSVAIPLGYDPIYICLSVRPEPLSLGLPPLGLQTVQD